jgi:hypothetical protein
MCKTPTNFKSDITNFVEFGCPEHNIFMRFDKENMNHNEFLEDRKREKMIKELLKE